MKNIIFEFLPAECGIHPPMMKKSQNRSTEILVNGTGLPQFLSRLSSSPEG